MIASERERERWRTRNLLLKLTLLAVGIPLGALFVIWIYLAIWGDEFVRADWRTVVLCLWLGTLAVLSWTALKSATGRKPFRRSWKYEDVDQEELRKALLRQTAGKWETRRTNQILIELMITVAVVPALACAVIYAYFYFLHYRLVWADWKIVVLCLWLGTILCLFRVGIRASRSKMIYADGE